MGFGHSMRDGRWELGARTGSEERSEEGHEHRRRESVAVGEGARGRGGRANGMAEPWHYHAVTRQRGTVSLNAMSEQYFVCHAGLYVSAVSDESGS